MTEGEMSASLEALITAAERARTAFDWEATLSIAGQALARPDLPPETAFALLDAQAEAHQRLGDLEAEEAARAAMARLASDLGDAERRVQATLQHVDLYLRQGRVADSKALSRAALDVARACGALHLEAAALVGLSRAYQVESRFDEARDLGEQALAQFRSLDNPLGEAMALLWLSITNSRQERVVEAAAQARAALEIFRREGDRAGEARALNTLGIRSPDVAQRRSYYEQALAAYEAVGDRRGQAQVHNNLAITSQQVGLYVLSGNDASEAVEVVRRMGARVDLAYYLDTLARAWLGRGDADRAEAVFEEGLAVCREVGDASVEASYIFGLGRAAHAAGRMSRAAELYQAAADRFGSLDIPAEQATCLAWLGAARLQLGDLDAARALTAQAVALLERAAGVAQEYPPQEIWWFRYQALAAATPPPLTGEGEVGDDAWLALDRAREVMLAGMASLSDDGLRRNSLNKVPVNRWIVGEWLHQVARRGLPLAPLADAVRGPGGGQEQFRRMLDIGLQLNTRRGAGDLARLLVDKVVELTGAESAALYRVEETGQRQVAAGFSLEPGGLAADVAPLLDLVTLKRQAVLRHVPANAPDLEQVSQLCVPLLASGTLVGLLYAGMATTFGRFSVRDRDLLSLLANQAAVALENAAWAERLDRRVTERTAELEAANRGLEQRTAELELINTVQQGLSAQLDMQAMYDLVGDKIRELFDAQVVGIYTYDHVSRLASMRYMIEKGQRYYTPEPYPFTRMADHLISTARPLLINEHAGQRAAEFGMAPVPGTEPVRSMLFVPLITGNHVTGAISLQNVDREHAFGDSDVRLLTTLANSLSVALENARLFDETNRLLAETQQRTAELEAINSVQQALAAQLDMEAIYGLVGDKMGDIFDAQAVFIFTYDHAARLTSTRYAMERGRRVYDDGPLPFSRNVDHLVRTRQAVLIDENTAERMAELGMAVLPGTEPPQSMLFVPLIAGNQVTGSVSLQNLDREHAFSDSDVRLLTTLANSMSVALENARLFDESRRLLDESRQLAAELATVNRISLAAASELDLEALIQAVGDQVRHTFDADMAYVALLDQQADLIRFPYSFGEDTAPMPLGMGLTSWIIETAQPLLINHDYEARSAAMGAVHVGLVPQSYLGVPILLSGQALGVIGVQSMRQQGRFDEDDQRLLSTIAANVGGALHNAQLYRETERRAFQMATIAQVGREVSATLELEAVLDSVAGHVHSLFRARDTVLRLRQGDGQSFHTIVSLGRYAEEFRSSVVTAGKGIVGYIAQSGVAEVIDDPSQDPRGVHVPGTLEVEESPETFMCAPLISRGQTLGLLSVYRDRVQGRFTQVDLDFLVALVREAAAAIENARLFEAEQRRAEQFQVIGEVSRRMISLLPVDELLWEISRILKETLGYYLVGIALVEGDELVFKAGAGAVWESHEFQPPRVQIGRQGITGWVARSGEPLLVNDLSQESRYYSLPEAGEMQSELAVPLKTKERVIGVLHVQSNRLNAFDHSDLAVLQSLAHQAAIAIENARLFTEVRRQQQYSESLVQNSPVAIVAVAAGDRITSWNPAAERLFGYSQAEAVGRNLEDLIAAPEMRAEALQFSDEAFNLGRVHAVTRRRRKDGSQVEVELLGVPVSTGDGQARLVAIYHDITELKEATRAIEESQRRMADIIDFLPDATLVIDREGKVIAWNRAMEEMTGVKAADMLGQGDHEYGLPFYGERRPILIDLVLLPDQELEARYAHIERHGATLIGEALVPVLRGRQAYLYATASALRDSGGEIVGAIETIRDISDRKQVEKELHQAKVAAEAATQAKSAFLATMSHEIRTPMNAVIGMTSLLLDTPLTPDQQEFATTIRSSGDALLAVINDILDFSKIEAGRIELEHQPFDVRECVESAVGLVAGQAAARGLELGCWIDPRVPAGIAGDETRLRQIVLNLLSNSLKFTEEGEVVVNVTVERQDEVSSALQVLHFAVRDTGLGIPPERVDRLFQSFSQVDSSTTRKYGGTGLGLAISRRLVDLMGGRMWAESAGVPGQGSTFHFTVEAQPASIPSRAELQGEAPDLRGRRVLIVDDSATNRRILTLQVESWGMLPRATGNSAEALEWVRRGEAFDLAILDRQMPEMDGVTLAAEIHKHQEARSLPLVMVSSLGRGEAEEAKELAAFLVKPVRASQLYNALVGILAGHKVETARPAAPVAQFDAEMGTRQPLRILLAEDNVVNQKLALRLLERLGYRADVAANGVEALGALERQPYDVVFMDVQMPEMDGLEATRQIHARWAGHGRPRIIAMTANAMAEDREACLAAGMDDYLAKPIRVEELVAALDRSESLREGREMSDEHL